jgi:hypothetical protein
MSYNLGCSRRVIPNRRIRHWSRRSKKQPLLLERHIPACLTKSQKASLIEGGVAGTFTRDPNGNQLAPPFKNSASSMNIQTQADDNSTDSKVFSWGLKADWDISDRLFMTLTSPIQKQKKLIKTECCAWPYLKIQVLPRLLLMTIL